jgi:L-alanine-DL-glutamate epimerase-like enolase superfamily enzyme
MIEQPVMGTRQMAELVALDGILTAIDEDSSSADAFLQPKVADVCCLKLQSCGGMDLMIEQAASARAVGMKVVIGSTLDGPIGIAAALHAAAVIKPDLPCGLATITNIAEAEQIDWVDGGTMAAPAGPGLGVDQAWRQDYKQ